MMDEPKISVAILTFNAEERIGPCLDAVLAQTAPADEIFVVDNASADRTVEIVARGYPDVRVFRNAENTGCSGGRNEQIRHAAHRYVMIVDDDAFLERTCLEKLGEAVRRHPEAAIWSPRICYDQDRGLIQFDAIEVHYLGEAVLTSPERRLDDEEAAGGAASNQLVDPNAQAGPLPRAPFVTAAQGGVCFLVDREAALSVGGYDESFFFGRTDGDFSFRLTLSGRAVCNVPGAVVYHRMKKRGLTQIARQVRNRWMFILPAYSWRTILVLLPPFLVYELSVIAFLAMKGGIGAYLAGCWQVIRNFPAIMDKRRAVQAVKRRRDREVLSGGFMNMRADLADRQLVRLAHRALNRFFTGYWAAFRWLVQ